MLFGNNGESVFVDKTVVNTKYRTVLLLSDIFVMKKLLEYIHTLSVKEGLDFEEMAINFLRIIEIRTSMDRSETS